MPCTDGGVPYAEDNRERERLKSRLDTATRLLCGLCRNLTQNGLEEGIEQVPGLAKWWNNHQEEDRVRLEAERKEREAREKKRRALNKLTAEDRKVLGL